MYASHFCVFSLLACMQHLRPLMSLLLDTLKGITYSINNEKLVGRTSLLR